MYCLYISQGDSPTFGRLLSGDRVVGHSERRACQCQADRGHPVDCWNLDCDSEACRPICSACGLRRHNRRRQPTYLLDHHHTANCVARRRLCSGTDDDFEEVRKRPERVFCAREADHLILSAGHPCCPLHPLDRLLPAQLGLPTLPALARLAFDAPAPRQRPPLQSTARSRRTLPYRPLLLVAHRRHPAWGLLSRPASSAPSPPSTAAQRPQSPVKRGRACPLARPLGRLSVQSGLRTALRSARLSALLESSLLPLALSLGGRSSKTRSAYSFSFFHVVTKALISHAAQIAGLETALASAQKTINERLGPAPVTDEDQGASEIDALRKDLASTRAELDELKAMTPKSDDLESIRGQLTAKETELVALRNQLEHDVEKSLNEVDTVRELLDNERKMKIEDENMLQTTLCAASSAFTWRSAS